MNIFKKVLIYLPRLHSRNLSRTLSGLQSCVAEVEDESNSTTKDRLLHPLTDFPCSGSNKVTIIGSGNVAKACAFFILAQHLTNEICIIDGNENRLQGELLDMKLGSIFVNNATVTSSTNFKVSADSQVCIVCCGVKRKPGDSSLVFTKANAEIIKHNIPRFVETSPDCTLILVTNPVDIMTYITLRVSGFPTNRVIGIGRALHGSQFRYTLAHRLKTGPTSSCNRMLHGEQGDSSGWSEANAAGVRLEEFNQWLGTDEDKLTKSGHTVTKNEKYTNWALALSCATITKAILRNFNTVHPVSICAKGLYGIEKEVCLSLPCVINANGAAAVVKQDFNDQELQQLQAMAEVIYKAQTGIEI